MNSKTSGADRAAKAHTHDYVQHPNTLASVCCSICGLAVPKSDMRRFVNNPHSLQITQAQREQLKALL